MNKIDIYIGIPIGIMSIAYPILIQVIANLDQKYSSERIVELFESEWEKKWFGRLLISSLVCIGILSFQFKPRLHGAVWDFLLPNSASFLTIAIVVALVSVFFLYINKILTYSNTTKFIKYLVDKHSSKKENLIYFEALSDILFFSIQKQNRSISNTLSGFFYNVFRSEREKSKGKPVEYPDHYYGLVYRTIEELAILEKKKNSALELRTAGAIWLLGELQPGEISEKTYVWLWRNIVLMVNHEQDDMVLYHWETAIQHFTYALSRIDAEWDYEVVSNEPLNAYEIRKRDTERARFLEFHYALGGLLLYKKRYSCLRRMFRYTTSQPPEYPLLPISTSQIFQWHYDFKDPYDSRFDWITRKYWFPKEEGLHSEGVVKRWIMAYTAVLILRQYAIIPYLTTMRPMELPALPQRQAEKREWIKGLDFFKELIIEALENKNLLSELRLDFITKEWCAENEKPYPLDFLETLRANLEAAYDQGQKITEVAPAKTTAFLTASKKIVANAIKRYQPILNPNPVADGGSKWVINGRKILQSKDGLAEDPEVAHLDFDSFLAGVVANDFREQIASAFLYNTTKRYLIKSDDLLAALERIGVDENFVIVAFHHNFKHASINRATVISLPGTSVVNYSLFVLRKDDLPSMHFNPVSEGVIQRYQLTEILPEYKVWASVIDLNQEAQETRDEFTDKAQNEELKKSALLSIIQETELRWKKSVKVIQLIEYYQYRQSGLPNSLADVQPYEEKQE